VANDTGLVRRAFGARPEARHVALASVRPTSDLDPTDIEVYGPKKEGLVYNYAGPAGGPARAQVGAGLPSVHDDVAERRALGRRALDGKNGAMGLPRRERLFAVTSR